MKLIKDLGMEYPHNSTKNKYRYGIYECPLCLKHFRVLTASAKNRKETKCNQCSRDIRTTNGSASNKYYYIWASQKKRCRNKTSQSYKHYGARGVTFSDEFLDFNIWNTYILSLENCGEDKYSIDRIDNNKGYERGNLRWATKETQARNTRKIHAHNTSGYRGVSWSKQNKKWIAKIMINRKTINIGQFDKSIDGAYAYDKYVRDNNLEHTQNFNKEGE